MAIRKIVAQGPNDYQPIFAKSNTPPQWWVFPDQLPLGEFRGLENRKDRSIVRGAFVLGQNIKLRDSGQPTLREGYEPIGTENTDAYPVNRAWVFETRDGYVFEIKAYNGSLYYYLKGVSTDYSLLKSGFTSGLEFGFGNIGESNGDFHSMFCNGVDPWYEFNGAYATVLSVTVNTITMAESGTFASRHFYSSGTRSVIVNGTERTYTGGESTATITGVSSTAGISPGDLIVQSPRLPTWRVFFPFSNISTGTFKIGETVTGGTSSATATIQRVAPDGTYIVVTGMSGTYVAGETITGGTSGATAALAKSIDLTLGPPLSSVVFAHLSRLHVRDESKKSAWVYSVLDDPYTWTVFGLDTSGGRKDIEFGGPIVAFGRLNQTIIAYKSRGVTALSFIQSGQKIDVPFYTPLIQSDDKGTTLGAIGQRSTFSSPYGMISVTVDGKMILLKAISQNNQPDYDIISDPVQPIFNMANHDDSSGLCADGVIWYSFKQSTASDANDAYITGDLRRQSVDVTGKVIPIKWDTVAIGMQIKDWTAVPDGQGSTSVHWHSSLNSNSYLINPEQKLDNGGSFTANVRTWSEVFGAPQTRKRADRGFIEILLRENSVINATLLLDEEGYTDRIPKVLRGDSLDNVFGTQIFNPFGASVFGSQRIGSNGEIDDRLRYRFYFELKKTPWFFNLALDLATDTENSDFELIRFGIRITDYEVTTPKALAI